MLKRIVAIISLAGLTIAILALIVEVALLARAHDYAEGPSLSAIDSSAPKPSVIASTVGDCDIAISPDSRLLTAVEFGGRGTVRIYRLADQHLVANLGTGGDSCAWSLDSALLGIARKGPPRLELWDTRTWKVVDRIDVPDSDGAGTHGNTIFGSLSFDQMMNVYVVARVESPNPRQTRSHPLAWWNSAVGRAKRLQIIGSHPNREAFSVAASRGTEMETRLAISYVCSQHPLDRNESSMEILDVRHVGDERTFRQQYTFPLSHEAWVRMRPDGEMAAIVGTGDFDAFGLFELTAQDLAGPWSPGKSNRPFDALQMRFRRADFSADNRVFAFVRPFLEASSHTSQVFDLTSGKRPLKLEWSTAVSLSADGSMVAVSGDGKILLYRLARDAK